MVVGAFLVGALLVGAGYGVYAWVEGVSGEGEVDVEVYRRGVDR